MPWGYKCDCGEKFTEGDTISGWESSDAFGPRIQNFVTCPGCHSADRIEEIFIEEEHHETK